MRYLGLIVMVCAASVEAQAPPPPQPLGINAAELSMLRLMMPNPGVQRWFRQLSPMAQKYLSEPSVSIVLVWADGTIHVRQGRPIAGNVYELERKPGAASDYQLLANHMAQPYFLNLLAAYTAPANSASSATTLAGAFARISSERDPGDREGGLAALAEIARKLDPDVRQALNVLEPRFEGITSTAAGRLQLARLENIRFEKFTIVAADVGTSWDAIIGHAANLQHGKPTWDTTSVVMVDLETGMKGYLRLKPGYDLSKPIDVLARSGHIQFFYGAVTADQVHKLDQSKLAAVLTTPRQTQMAVPR